MSKVLADSPIDFLALARRPNRNLFPNETLHCALVSRSKIVEKSGQPANPALAGSLGFNELQRQRQETVTSALSHFLTRLGSHLLDVFPRFCSRYRTAASALTPVDVSCVTPVP
jgi:hypothetical protein